MSAGGEGRGVEERENRHWHKGQLPCREPTPVVGVVSLEEAAAVAAADRNARAKHKLQTNEK